MTSRPDRSGPDREWLIFRQITRALTRARLALFWERLWPRLVPPLIVAGLFALFSLAGLWPALPEWLRIAALAGFAILGLASLYPLTSLRWPSRGEAFVRVEQATGAPHRPATGFFDRLAGPDADAETKAIWEAHRARLIASFGTVRAGLPSPGVPRRDQYALRFLLLLALTVAFAATGGRFDRLGDAFRGGSTAALAEIAGARIDAWATPPGYTGRPAILLTGENVSPPGGGYEVPQGTEIVVRVAGDDAETIVVEAADTGTAIAEQPRLGEGPREFRAILSSGTEIAVAADGRRLGAWSFSVIPDRAPTIAITGGPDRATGGGLQVAYAFADDYGVTDAWGEIMLANAMPAARPLVDAPVLELTVPRADPRQGEAIAVRDLSNHPWAGLEVDLTLIAADAIGQIGLSETRRTSLPGRIFVHPVARELIAARQVLAIDGRQVENVLLALATVSEMPEAAADLGTFLAVRSAYHRLANAGDEDDLRRFLDYLWEIATALEADPLADAAAGLQAAADALRDAIERGATDAEIAELTENLRAAMAQYMQAAMNANGQQRQPAQAVNVETEIMRPDELDDMVDQIGEFAQTGNTEAAEQLLNQLEQMMQNMEVGNIDEMQRQFQPAEEALDDLGYLMQEQQRLMDETFQLQQELLTPIPNPQTEEEAERLLDDLLQRREEQEARAEELAREQRLLRDNLTQLLERMMGDGAETFGLPDAEVNMGDAAERIGERRPGLAIPEQAEALEQLRATAEALANQVAQEGATNLLNENGGQQDPFGRTPPREGDRYGDNVQVPTEIERQTARAILEIIRQRLEERGRPPAELEYLERLIELY